MIAVDASALTAFILKEPGWERLTKYLTYAISVDYIVKEVANAIWKFARLRNRVSAEEALRLLDIVLSMVNKNIFLEPEDKYVREALRIAIATGITVYDALYIALALDRGLPLLTLDAKQARTAEKLGIRVVTFSRI